MDDRRTEVFCKTNRPARLGHLERGAQKYAWAVRFSLSSSSKVFDCPVSLFFSLFHSRVINFFIVFSNRSTIQIATFARYVLKNYGDRVVHTDLRKKIGPNGFELMTPAMREYLLQGKPGSKH
jgi:hypothetical protein